MQYERWRHQYTNAGNMFFMFFESCVYFLLYFLQIALLGGEMCFAAISRDQISALTNPFTDYKKSQR